MVCIYSCLFPDAVNAYDKCVPDAFAHDAHVVGTRAPYAMRSQYTKPQPDKWLAASGLLQGHPVSLNSVCSGICSFCAIKPH